MTAPKRDRSASRQAALRERLRDAGLVPVQVWVRPERRAEVMALDQRREIAPAARVKFKLTGPAGPHRSRR